MPAKVFTIDADTVSQWLLNETTHGNKADEITTSPGYNITLAENVANFPEIVGPLIVPGGTKCVRFEGTSPRFLRSTAQPAGLETVLDGPNVSYECILQPARGDGSARGICRYSPTAGGPEEAKNELISLQVTGASKLKIGWEYGAGLGLSYTTTASLWTTEQSADAHYLAVTINSSAVIKIYVDGTLIETSPAQTSLPTGGTDSTMRWTLGEDSDGLVWLGHMDEFTISKKERTQAEITAAYNRWVDLRNGGTTIDSTAPVISNMVPAAGSSIQPSGTLVFNVHDVTPGMRANFIWIKFNDRTYKMLVHDGSATGFPYPFDTSTRTGSGTQADPYIYTLRHSGGWPTGGFTISVRPIDQHGNLEGSL